MLKMNGLHSDGVMQSAADTEKKIDLYVFEFEYDCCGLCRCRGAYTFSAIGLLEWFYH